MINKNFLCLGMFAMLVMTAVFGGCKAKPAPDTGDNEVIEVNANQAQPAAAVTPEELFKESCVRCHIIEKAVAYSGETPWKDLVARMIQHGAKITPENADIIVKHLETKYPLKTAASS